MLSFASNEADLSWLVLHHNLGFKSRNLVVAGEFEARSHKAVRSPERSEELILHRAHRLLDVRLKFPDLRVQCPCERVNLLTKGLEVLELSLGLRDRCHEPLAMLLRRSLT
jgi:hypothetical protein